MNTLRPVLIPAFFLGVLALNVACGDTNWVQVDRVESTDSNVKKYNVTCVKKTKPSASADGGSTTAQQVGDTDTLLFTWTGSGDMTGKQLKFACQGDNINYGGGTSTDTW